ncbi:MAG: 2-methylcitrate dehydratase [Legionellales bacterium RIFCSPHIGHO2_12_FULL_37_14]|nr:MAG: 2-methylcitrate dehydratase [Legionellales bacterium RIFCSPHIGHO2_12_FULL_37_14]
MQSVAEDNRKPPYDEVLVKIADYILDTKIDSSIAYDTARLCLMDSLGCAILALKFPECRKLIGPIVKGAVLPGGARVIGTHFELDPVQAAFNIGALIRWIDFNDTWLAKEWGHPSDNLGAILALADYLSRERVRAKQPPVTVQQILTLMIKAYEIQGIMALDNSFNKVGLDHVILVKLASAAVASHLLGANKDQVLRTLSLVFVDGQSLRTYRHSPNAGSRKSWAAGDATSRAVRLALLANLGEMGYPSALSAKTWGFYAVSFKGQQFNLSRPFGSYVMENILFKLSYPAEFHAQTAVECAVKLYPTVKDRLDEIDRIEIHTHESAIRIISKEGPLHHPADRDHCLQYMVAIGLIYGNLTAEHYEDALAKDPRIDALREKMQVFEDKQYSQDYLAADKRSIANRIQIFFTDNTASDPISSEYPIGHLRRRKEGIPILAEKCRANLATMFKDEQIDKMLSPFTSVDKLASYSVDRFMTLWSLPQESF